MLTTTEVTLLVYKNHSLRDRSEWAIWSIHVLHEETHRAHWRTHNWMHIGYIFFNLYRDSSLSFAIRVYGYDQKDVKTCSRWSTSPRLGSLWQQRRVVNERHHLVLFAYKRRTPVWNSKRIDSVQFLFKTRFLNDKHGCRDSSSLRLYKKIRSHQFSRIFDNPYIASFFLFFFFSFFFLDWTFCPKAKKNREKDHDKDDW